MKTAPLPVGAQSTEEPLTLETIASVYPRLYSEKRLTEWQALFDDHAVAVRIERGVATSFLKICEAMPEQQEYARENRTLLETWERVDIHRYGNIAVMKADYSLTADHEIRKGIDVLTLVNGDNGWRIISITYEQTEMTRR